MADYSSFFNEDGEPLMSGEDMRREMYYDSLYEPDVDSFYDHPDWDNDGPEDFEDDDFEPSWDGYLGEE